jgi:hypothetical protein
MATRTVALLSVGLLLGGCMQSVVEPASEAAMKPRDKQLLANPPYAKASIPEAYQRHIVSYHRRELAGTIVVDTDARYLYYVLPDGARRNGPPGFPPRKSISASRACRSSSKADRRTRSAPAASTCSTATRTRCSASTAPTSLS